MEVLIGKIMQVYSLEKEQFEKNDAFQERKHQLFQELMNDKLYSVEIQFVPTKYDADLELWKAEIGSFEEGDSDAEGLEQFPRIEVSTEMKRLIDDTYIGHNAMGVEVKVQRTYTEFFGFLVFLQEYQSILRAGIEKRSEDDFNYLNRQYYYMKIPMPVEIARNYKGDSPFQYRAVFKLMDNISNKDDIFIENILSTSPTFSSPRERLGKSLYMRVHPIALIAHDREKKLVHYLPFVNE